MRVRIITAAVVAMLFSACASSSNATNEVFPANPSANVIDSFRLTDTEVPTLEKEALYGNSESALRLFQYSEYVKKDKSESRYWLLMAAQNGSKPAMKRLGQMMQADNNNYRNYLRANYWLKRAGS